MQSDWHWLITRMPIRFPLPEIPPGWKPNPRRVWEQEKNKENVQVVQPKPTPTTHAAWKDRFMSADEVSWPSRSLPLVSSKLM